MAPLRRHTPLARYLAVLAVLNIGSNAVVVKRDLTVPVVQGWVSKGCWADSTSQRTLQSAFQYNATLTVESCLAFCQQQNFAFAGVEYSTECYCSNYVLDGTVAEADGDCNMACGGDKTEACGGPDRLNLYQSTTYAAPAVAQGSSGYEYYGCMSDSPASRTLGVGMGVEGDMTASKCLAACAAQGYKYAGVEFASECYCGNALLNGRLVANGESLCNLACKGDPSEICGGAGGLSTYQSTTNTNPDSAPLQLPAGWTDNGCYSDSVTDRTLPFRAQIPTTTLTVENCIAACSAAGYTIAGVEYAQECYCGNSTQIGTPETDGCSMACLGNAAETCGGPDRLNTYIKAPVVVDDNLLSNPGFENTPGTPLPWVITGYNLPAPSYGASVTTSGCNGKQCLLFQASGVQNFALQMTQNITVVPGTTYDVGHSIAAVNVPAGVTCYFGLKVNRISVFYIQLGQSATLQSFSTGRPATADSWNMLFQLSCSSSSSIPALSVTVDDFFVRPAKTNYNLFKNPGFEQSPTDIAPWYYANTGAAVGSLVVEQAHPFAGQNNGKLTYDTSGVYGQNVWALQNLTGLTVGSTYRLLVAWSGDFPAGDTQGYCQGSPLSGNDLNNMNGGPSITWTSTGVGKVESSTIFNARTANYMAGIRFYCVGGAGPRYMYFDNLYVAEMRPDDFGGSQSSQ